MVTEKKCFKCNEIKSLEEFYKHAGMADGYLNKCKKCARSDVHKNRSQNIEYYKQYDRSRAMREDRVVARLEYNKTERGKEARKTAYANAKNRRPERHNARVILNNAVRDGRILRPTSCTCGATGRIEAHHEDYSKPLEVSWLCVACHKQAHK